MTMVEPVDIAKLMEAPEHQQLLRTLEAMTPEQRAMVCLCTMAAGARVMRRLLHDKAPRSAASRKTDRGPMQGE